MVAFHRQAKPLRRWGVDVVWVAMFRQQEGWMWVLAFQGEYNIHLYGRVSIFAHYHKLEHIMWIITRFYLYSPFPQAILMQKDTANNAILPTFANDGYLLIGDTRGREVNG